MIANSSTSPFYEALRHAHFTALRGAVTKHNGSEVKTTDGLMLRFDSAASAIACAISMQQATSPSRRRQKDGGSSGRTEESPEPNGSTARPEEAPSFRGRLEGRSPLQIRIGISSGEATYEDGDVFGTPVTTRGPR
jgi:class 3 adenylate cyclase